MNTDYNSAEAVVQMIEQTGLSKFIIQRAGAMKNSTPVYEYVNNTQNNKAVDAFKKWASITENTNAYEMILFDSLDNIQQENDISRGKKNKAVRFSFCLKGSQSMAGVQQYQQQPPVNTADLVEQVVARLSNLQKDERMKALEDKLDAFLNEEDEEDEPESAMSGASMLLIVDKVADILERADVLKPKKAPALISGADENLKVFTAAQQKNIDDALKILHKADPQIDQDLIRLANIATSKKETFDLLLTNLRAMS